MLRLLLSRGASVAVTGAGGLTPLMIAAQQSYNTDVLSALIAGGADVRATTLRGDSAMGYCATDDNLVALLDAGGDACAVTVSDDRTPLISAAIARGNQALAQALFDKGANLYARDASGRTVLAFAGTASTAIYWLGRGVVASRLTVKDRADVLTSVLLGAGSETLTRVMGFVTRIIASGPVGGSCLTAAALTVVNLGGAEPGWIDVTRALLNAACDVNAVDAAGVSALAAAAGKSLSVGAAFTPNMDLVALLLAAAPSRVTKNAALAAAICSRKADLARALLAAGAECHAVDAGGTPMLALAAGCDAADQDMVNVILVAGPPTHAALDAALLATVSLVGAGQADALAARVSLLLGFGAHATAANAAGMPALALAAGAWGITTPNVGAVTALLGAGADARVAVPRADDSSKVTDIFTAVTAAAAASGAGVADVMKLLITGGHVDLALVDKTTLLSALESALRWAATAAAAGGGGGGDAPFEPLVAVLAKAAGGVTAAGLAYAAACSLAVFNHVVGYAGADALNAALYAAAAAYNPAIVSACLLRGASPDAVNADNGLGWTPLHAAMNLDLSAGQGGAWDRQTATLRALLQGGADPNATDLYGGTPLHLTMGRTGYSYTILELNKAFTEALVACGADATGVNSVRAAFMRGI